MSKKLSLFLCMVILYTGLVSPLFALEKVKLGSSVKLSPAFYLPVLAAEEKGFWKANGLEVEWVPFKGGTAQMRAVAAGAISIALSGSDQPMLASERGLPLIMVSDLCPSYPIYIYVKADSPYRHMRDLKGKRIGLPTKLGIPHTYARIMTSAFGIEKEVRFVATGGVRETIAGLRVNAYEAVSQPLTTMARLKAKGGLRSLASSADHLPKPWTDLVVFARKDFTKSKPAVVRQTLKGLLQSVNFIQKDPRWAVEKMKSFSRFPEKAAKLVQEDFQFTTDGRLDQKAVENLRTTLIKYGVLTEKAPPADKLFTNQYLP